MVAYAAREEAGLSLSTVAKYFTRDEATLSLAVLRLETQMAADPQLSSRISSLRRIIRRGARRRRQKQIIKA
jgi:chromosomal replication initiation ATPase DnaA